ncbi:LysM peptidoglycan-binding domain-containing protein, partial [Cellulomonas carbonis]
AGPTRDVGAATGGPGSSAPATRAASPEADPGRAAPVGSTDPTVVVRPGDTLWSIAAATMPGADDAAVAAAWPHWYEANADRIGPDPGLILPGTVLVAPSDEAAR